MASGKKPNDGLNVLTAMERSSAESEERLKAYLLATTDAVYVMSADWSEMRQLSGSGFLADTAHPNTNWMDPYIPLEARERVQQAIDEAVQSRSMFQLEHAVRRSDGTTGWTLSRAIPLFGKDGAIKEWIGAATDISFLRQNDELRKALAERDALLKEVHHRVKNNLQVITSMLEMQAHQTSDPHTLLLFEDACNRVGSIAVIHEMLYLSNSFTTVDLPAYSRRLVPYLIAFYQAEQRIAMEIDGDGAEIELERAVPCGLLLNELVSNTCKHAFPGGASGTLRVSFVNEPSHIRVVVEDSGVGFPAGFGERDAATLGIKLVRTLVEQLRGGVQFSSHQGSRVEITIPRNP